MHTAKKLFELVSVLVCFAAVIWLAVACGEENQLQDEAACVNRIEREIARRVEEMRFLPIPQDVAYCEEGDCRSDCVSEECWNDYKKYQAENELIKRVFDKHDDKFWRQGFVFAMGVGRLEDDDGDIIGEPTIFIYVSHRDDYHSLPEHVIPDRLECVGIRIEEIDLEGKVNPYSPITKRRIRWRCITQGIDCDYSWAFNRLWWDY